MTPTRPRIWTLSAIAGLLVACPGGGGMNDSGTTGMTESTGMTPPNTTGVTPPSDTTSVPSNTTAITSESSSTGGPTTTVTATDSSDSTTSEDSTSTGGPPPPPCVDADLGTMLGNNLLMGTNLGAGDDVTLDCFGGSFIDPTGGSFIDPTTGGFIDPTTGGFIDPTGGFTDSVAFIDPTGGFTDTGGFIDPTGFSTVAFIDPTTGGFIDPTTGGFSFDSEDYLVSWTAPNAGTYAISLVGSNFDTVLGILDACGGNQVQCNDDCFDLQSGITIMLEAGEQIILVIEGYGGQTGTFNININEGVANCFF